MKSACLEPGKSQNEAVLELRNNFKRKCSIKVISSYPHVVLKYPPDLDKDKITYQDQSLNNPSANFKEEEISASLSLIADPISIDKGPKINETLASSTTLTKNKISQCLEGFKSAKSRKITEDEGPKLAKENYELNCPIDIDDSSFKENDQIRSDEEDNDLSFACSNKSPKGNENLTSVKTIIKFEPELHIFDIEFRNPETELTDDAVNIIDQSEAVQGKINKTEQPLASIADSTLTSPTSRNEQVEITFSRRLRTVHKCTSCDKTFATLQSLLLHIEDSGCLDNMEVESEEDEEVDQTEADDNYLNTTSESEEDNESVNSDCSDKAEGIKPEQKKVEPETMKKKKYKRKMEEECENDKKDYLIVKNKKGRWQCCFCSKSYPPNGKLRMHMLQKHPAKWKLAKFPRKQNVRSCHRYKCLRCDEMFEKAHLLLIHWKKEHEKPENTSHSIIPVEIVSFTSSPDSQVFQSLHEDLKKPQHFAKVEMSVPEEILICAEKNCERPFYSKEDLEVHKTLHGTFSCGVSCSETKSFLPELAVHEKKCNGRKGTTQNYQKCSRCDFKFKDYSVYLFTYLQQFHDLANLEASKKEIFRCDQENCTAYFLKLFSLDYHRVADHGLSKAEMKKLRGARKSVCETCGKAFSKDEYLGRHLLVHSGPESWDFTCKVCSKKCISESKLNEHMRTHTKEKPFVCEVCGATYGHRHNLRIHVNSKHGDVVQDIAQRYNTSNLTSKKGTKRKTFSDLD